MELVPSTPEPPQNPTTPDPLPRRPKPAPRRFIKNQIPDSILSDQNLNSAISLLPRNYNFEIHKIVWRVRSSSARRVALQLPEGLLMYSLVLSDIVTTFAGAEHCFVLGDVTYGACCVDDLSAKALNSDLLVHFGHSCLVPVDHSEVPCLYVFVDIEVDVDCLVRTVRFNVPDLTTRIVLAGTIQFGSAIRAAKPELEKIGFGVLIPQSRPLSAGEVLGCTAPRVSINGEEGETVLVFVADGRFHLEAFMIANPGIKAFRYDPYVGKLFLEEYDHKGMKESRKKAILKAKREARNWGIVMGTLGRQGNPKILDRLEGKMRDLGFEYTVILMSELSPARISLFEDSIDAWIQIACPRLSIDWGEAFVRPLLTPFEAEIALGFVPGWWERSVGCGDGGGGGCGKSDSCCSSGNGGGGCGKSDSCCSRGNVVAESDGDAAGDYPMDYYAQEGGEWNSTYVRKSNRTRPMRRNLAAPQ